MEAWLGGGMVEWKHGWVEAWLSGGMIGWRHGWLGGVIPPLSYNHL